MTIVNALRCPKCKDVIYSRARHDYHTCSCGIGDDTNDFGISVDGGFDYLKYGWANDLKVEDIDVFELEIDASKEELYQDWNKQINQFGTIKGHDVFFDKNTQEDRMLDWFWDQVLQKGNYEYFIDIFQHHYERNYMVEQLYCEGVYENRT